MAAVSPAVCDVTVRGREGGSMLTHTDTYTTSRIKEGIRITIGTTSITPTTTRGPHFSVGSLSTDRVQ